MKVNVYTRTVDVGQEILYNFAIGAKRFDDVRLITDKQYHPSDVAVLLWSPKIVQGHPETLLRREVFLEQQKMNQRTLLIEQPLIRDARKGRFYQFRIGFDDVTRIGEYGANNSPSDRWDALDIKIHDWRKNGTDIIVIGQLPGDYSLGGTDINQWVIETIETIARHTDRPIKFKPHPIALRDKVKLPEVPVPTITEMNWDTTWTTVTFSSGMCIDSLIMGVPCITTSERSFAWDISTHDLTDIENVMKPHRKQWLSDLAYTQWSEQEMREGIPWKRLRKYI